MTIQFDVTTMTRGDIVNDLEERLAKEILFQLGDERDPERAPTFIGSLLRHALDQLVAVLDRRSFAPSEPEPRPNTVYIGNSGVSTDVSMDPFQDIIVDVKEIKPCSSTC